MTCRGVECSDKYILISPLIYLNINDHLTRAHDKTEVIGILLRENNTLINSFEFFVSEVKGNMSPHEYFTRRYAHFQTMNPKYSIAGFYSTKRPAQINFSFAQCFQIGDFNEAVFVLIQEDGKPQGIYKLDILQRSLGASIPYKWDLAGIDGISMKEIISHHNAPSQQQTIRERLANRWLSFSNVLRTKIGQIMLRMDLDEAKSPASSSSFPSSPLRQGIDVNRRHMLSAEESQMKAEKEQEGTVDRLSERPKDMSLSTEGAALKTKEPMKEDSIMTIRERLEANNRKRVLNQLRSMLNNNYLLYEKDDGMLERKKDLYNHLLLHKTLQEILHDYSKLFPTSPPLSLHP